MLLSLVLNFGFTTHYREARPFFEEATSDLMNVCNWMLVLCAITLLVENTRDSDEEDLTAAQHTLAVMLIAVNVVIGEMGSSGSLTIIHRPGPTPRATNRVPRAACPPRPLLSAPKCSSSYPRALPLRP